jgi:dTDP-4-amino-4,6-dideoxygalactose transaminase
LNVSREDFLRALHAENIGANVHYIPVYFHPYYRNLGYPRGLCPVAEKAYFQEISIPLYPTMTESDAQDVVVALTKLLEHFSR